MGNFHRNLVPKSQDLLEKENVLKPDFWIDVCETYLAKKNQYLSWRQQMDEHPSFNCYIEAVNEVYEKVRRGVL